MNVLSFQATSLYERAVNTEETAERHVLLAEALVLAERRNEALWHYERAANLYDDRQYKVGRPFPSVVHVRHSKYGKGNKGSRWNVCYAISNQ